ncbi:hypothetical protein [Sphingomonas sp. Leaf34]|uniref:hypothetical protein n=1 Tax=Sphingomonas sp. Leaf34 TaxID=1736216 RepID=UPI000B153E94|nr:hypothetical protein [Sphingomonas sp. Leaf34]
MSLTMQSADAMRRRTTHSFSGHLIAHLMMQIDAAVAAIRSLTPPSARVLLELRKRQ